MTPEIEALSDAQRMTKNLCPECGKDMVGLSALAEREYHYPRASDVKDGSDVLKRRYKLLTDYATAHAAKE